ncbi:MAG: PQQ-like beta-propeller repeat protein, partial [Dehalococcoidales bacterium]|nr:PQQ-like beta-propeller repeat protein [Dehalococcoidales bacterium]
ATDGSKKWEFKAGGAIASTPLIYNNTVYIGSFDRYLYALNATDGSLKWKFLARDWFWTRPVAYNGVVYAGCLDGKVYALDAQSGNKLAEFDLESPVCSSPVLVGSSIIVASEKGRVYAVDTSNNQIRQLANIEEKIYAPLSTSDGVIYIHTDAQTLYVLTADTGVRLWSLSLKK